MARWKRHCNFFFFYNQKNIIFIHVFVTRWRGGGGDGSGGFTIFIIWYSIFYAYAYIINAFFAFYLIEFGTICFFHHRHSKFPLFLLHAFDGSRGYATASMWPLRAWPRLQDNKMPLYVRPVKTILRLNFFRCACAPSNSRCVMFFSFYALKCYDYLYCYHYFYCYYYYYYRVVCRRAHLYMRIPPL